MNNQTQIIQSEHIRELLHRLPEDARSRIIDEELTQLPIEKRAEIVARQLPQGLSRVLEGSSTVVNPSPDEMSKLLEDLPPKTLADLIRAASETIASRIKSQI